MTDNDAERMERKDKTSESYNLGLRAERVSSLCCLTLITKQCLKNQSRCCFTLTDVGFLIGGQTPVRYLVLQIHYKSSFQGSVIDLVNDHQQ